ncbi:MAG: FAD-dependent oxidoreductase [Promethearchaeota archaeon]
MEKGNKKTVRNREAVKLHYLPVEERINNFKEVNLGYLTLEEVIEECERCYQCFQKSDPQIKPPPCMKYCPTHCNSRDIIKNVLTDNIEDALEIIYEHYPIPRCVERVCPGYCQLYCTAGKKGDPIQIPMIKRFLVDHFGLNKKFYEHEEDRGKKVAVIGSGPLGLTVSFYLRKYGINVSIFEKLNIIGGMLITEIPEFRLPRNVLKVEIENIQNFGVSIINKKGIDDNFSVNYLFDEGFDAVVVGIGSQKAKWMNLPGEDSEIILHAIQFLKDFNLKNKIPDLEKKKVVVIGGGSTATDTARVAKRLGANVTILYRREKVHMPAGRIEIEHTEEEGINMEFLINPKEFICIEDEFQGAVCHRMELGEVDLTGRPNPIPIEGTEIKIEADLIIEAVGQHPDLTGFDLEKFRVTKNNTFDVDENYFTSVPKVFAGGDCVLGSKSVVHAIAHGKIIANQIIKSLK